MARTIQEIMSRELLSLRPSESTDDALEHLLALGVTAAPVTGRGGQTLGIVSIRDLAARRREGIVARAMHPAVRIGGDWIIEDAARVLAEAGAHQAVVVDALDRAIGMVSALDLVRALIGLPATGHAVAMHYDAKTGVAFSEDLPFDAASANLVPDAPGVLVLVAGGRNRRESVVWSEACENLRARLHQLTGPGPHDESGELSRLLGYPAILRVRVAKVPDFELRHSIARSLMGAAVVERSAGSEATP